MLIDVTLEDIEFGTPRKPAFCPVALALHRATGQAWNVISLSVNNERLILLARTDLSYNRLASETVRQFVIDFDQGNPVQPLSFELDWEPEPDDITGPTP